jgi:DNA ligase-1
VASFLVFAELCQALSQTQSRLQMAELVGDFLATLDAAEAVIAARFTVGRATAQGDESRLKVSGRAIWKIVAAMTGAADQGEEIFAAATDFGEAIEIAMRLRADQPPPTLTIAEVERRFIAIAAIEGRQSRARKLEALRELLALATALEGKYLTKILIGEMRHGVSEGMMLEAIAKMAARPVAEVRRLYMLEGDLGRVVGILRGAPPSAAAAERRESVRPLKPMLAHPVRDVAAAFTALGPELALEHKLDGARVQIHCLRDGVRIFSRRLNEITPSLPEVVSAASPLIERGAIFDGEAIAVDGGGRPLAFQELMRRWRRVREVARLQAEQPVKLFVFDLLALDGALLIDRPYAERFERLSELAAGAGLELVGRIVPDSLAEGERFFEATIAAGHEGVMAKSLGSHYTPGVRGRGWLKIKRAKTLDLVIVAAEWGYGRRHGWLSNYHLAARDEPGGRFAEVGKTFKGLTDEQFRELTDRLLALKIEESSGVVAVRPELVVEVAYSDIQRSPQYADGMALRFARIVAIRDDKSAAEADTVATMRREFEHQVVRPL